MTNKEAIKYLQQLYPNGGHCWLDEQRIEAIDMAIKALQKEHVSGTSEKEKKRLHDIQNIPVDEETLRNDRRNTA